MILAVCQANLVEKKLRSLSGFHSRTAIEHERQSDVLDRRQSRQ
jgi:hypothetical protein